MIEKQGKIENARWVEGDLGVHFVYTAGLAGEEFLRAMAKGKFLASTCDRCSKTYLPPRIFCEDCFHEIADRHEVGGTGTIVSLTRLEVDADGQPADPQWVAAIQLDGTDTTLLHRLDGADFEIGSRVEAVWASRRAGSILDVEYFRPVGTGGPKARATGAVAEGNGGARRPRRTVPA